MKKKAHGIMVGRRTFLKGAVAGIGAVGMAGLRTAEAKTENLHQVPKWDHTAEVVIIGYGAAGGSAAVAAHDAGAKVLLLEKMPVAGGNSGVCYGGMVIPDTVPEAIEYYRKLSFGTVDEDMLQGFAEAMVGLPDLLIKLGADLPRRFREYPPAFPALRNSGIPAFRFRPTGERGLQFLSGLIEKRGIKVMLKTSAKNLIQVPETGEVVGVRAENDGREIHVRAEKGVVLCCGGYENAPEMFAYYNYPGLRDTIFPDGTPGNTGDGLKMASAAGAYLWHTASLQWGSFCAKVPSKQFGVAVGSGIPRPTLAKSFIFVNKYGKRFMNETKSFVHYKGPLDVLHFDHDRAEYPNVPAYLVFDESYRKSGAISRSWKDLERIGIGAVGYAAVHKIYDWSADNVGEIEKGWIIKADTVAALAGRIKVDTKGLEETICRFNSYCAAGQDPEFNRHEGSVSPVSGAQFRKAFEFGKGKDAMAPMDEPPYYAVEMGLVLVNTQGGPKRNRYCQVLDHDNKPIPRLYAAGELGSFFGFLYQEGSNYPEAWAFGHIAGRQAASEKRFNG